MTDKPTPATRKHKLKYHHKVHAEALAQALNHRQPWTGRELQIAPDLTQTARAVALRLGRTPAGVHRIRRKYLPQQ